MMHRTLPLLLVATTTMQAQSVLNVPGGYPDIGAAVAAASPGDIIRVAAGNYPPFLVNKGVTIRSAGTGMFGVNGVLPSWSIPAGQVLHVIGGGFQQVAITGGRATFDGCTMTACSATALLVDHATVHLQDCYLTGCFLDNPALSVVSGDVTMVLTTMNAVHALTLPPMIQLDASRLHASRCQLNYNAYPCVSAIQGSTAWISDTDISQGQFGCPLHAVNSWIRTDRVQILSASQAGCATGIAGTLVGVDRPQPMQLGAPFTVQYHSAPNDFVVVFASTALSTVDWSPLLEQPSWLDASSSVAVTVLLADPLGHASATWSIPGNPTLANQTLWFKGIGGFAGWPLQASPVVGGLVR